MANPLRIRTQMSCREIEGLIELVKLVAHPNMKVLEIGTGQSGSAIIMYKEVVAKFGGMIFTIDIKPASEIDRLHSLHPQINFMIGRSEDFLKILSPFAEFDLIFIDGSHLYQDVVSDIQLSLPLLREGGILCGHDCENKYSDYRLEEQQDIDSQCQLGQDTLYCHAGVVKALHDVFQDNYEHHSPHRVWHVKKISASLV